MVERTPERRIVILPLQNRNKNTCNMFLRRFVNKNSNIYSDGWKGYNDVKTYFNQHEVVNHKMHFKIPLQECIQIQSRVVGTVLKDKYQ